MKKFTLFVFCLTMFLGTTKSQQVFYNETFGTPALDTPVTTAGESKNELIQNHVWDYGILQGITYSWTLVENADPTLPGSINVRNNNASSYSGASGVGNLYFNANATNSFTITGNTSEFSDVKLSFGVFGKAAGDAKKLVVSYSIDGGNQFIPIATTQIAALTAAAKGWELISNITFPTSSSVKLKFSTPNLGEIRIDDVKLSGTKINSGLYNPEANDWSFDGKTLSFVTLPTTHVEVFALTGSKVASYKPAGSINLNLSKGIYFIRFDNKAVKVFVR